MRHKRAWIDLKKLRSDRGLLQWEAAEKLGVSRAYLSSVESGRQGISMNMMESIIRVFGVRYEDFHAYSDHPGETPHNEAVPLSVTVKRLKADLKNRVSQLETQDLWYKAILDAITFPVRVSDAELNWQFINTSAEALFGSRREEMLGKPCGHNRFSICGTDNCSLARAKRGLMQTFFKHASSSYQVDVEVLKNSAGETTGYIEMIHDVTRIASTARMQADTESKAKTDFLATMSHEMRTPLNAVIGLSELLLGENSLDAAARLNIEKVYSAGTILLRIINDILDISKIEAGRLEITPAEYSVPSMINDAVTQNILRKADKPINFALNISLGVPDRLIGDEMRVRQVVSNLLSNAFKYTAKGEIGLDVSREDVDDELVLVIRVSDTGSGIREEDMELLFTEYVQLHKPGSNQGEGTGLGLAITKRLVEMMGGHISVKSIYGKGSVFTARIPQLCREFKPISPETRDSLKRHSYSQIKRAKNARAPLKLQRARVLVVDDNITNLDVAMGLLLPYGMKVDCLTSGAEAIDAIKEAKIIYDAVFMDHMMPGMDGVEAVREIRKIDTDYARGVPIIALTANVFQSSVNLFMENGFQAFLPKPVDTIQLDEIILRWIQPGQVREESPAPQGLDLEEGLKRFGSEKTFGQILRSFAVNTAPLLASLKQPRRDRLNEYSVTVHGIKSSCRAIGAEDLGAKAQALEKAASAGDWAFVSGNNQAFLADAVKTVEYITSLLDRHRDAQSRPTKPKINHGTLEKLLYACENYDLDGAEHAIDDLEKYEYTHDGRLAASLRESLERLDLSGITSAIKRELDRIGG